MLIKGERFFSFYSFLFEFNYYSISRILIQDGGKKYSYLTLAQILASHSREEEGEEFSPGYQ